MVYYFKSTAVTPAAEVYVGKDKFENETLISYGWDNDVWYVPLCEAWLLSCDLHRISLFPDYLAFHVDNLSSAHIYLRMQDGQQWDQIPEDLLKDLAQLTKANSIEGNKRNNVTVVYTPWSNLRKSGAMVAGEVSFHDTRLVKKVFVPARENAIINRLNKTRVEKFPDLREMRDEELQRKRKIKRQETSAGREQEKERLRELAEVKRARRDADALVQKQLEEERKKLEEQLENGGEAAEEEEFW